MPLTLSEGVIGYPAFEPPDAFRRPHVFSPTVPRTRLSFLKKRRF